MKTGGKLLTKAGLSWRFRPARDTASTESWSGRPMHEIKRSILRKLSLRMQKELCCPF